MILEATGTGERGGVEIRAIASLNINNETGNDEAVIVKLTFIGYEEIINITLNK